MPLIVGAFTECVLLLAATPYSDAVFFNGSYNIVHPRRSTGGTRSTHHG